MKLYNSLQQRKELFIPHEDKKVSLYVCGITPYDTTHLGHAFTYIFFDVLRRYLESQSYTVIYTQNVTDIDDDILKRARLEKRDWKELGNYWTHGFLTDMQSLNVSIPTYYVKATDSIATILIIIKTLLAKDSAYEKSGTVYFRVSADEDYGKLSKYNPDKMRQLSMERGADPNDSNKENPLDFILWQKSKNDEPYWESPWGRGRPGWHIECSAMNYQYLGKQIDIHGGGQDLIYPHHESEIAQSETFTGKKPFAKYWLHTSMLMYNGEKMSKSLGNLVMVSDLLKTYSANAIRYVLLSHHYRSTWEFHRGELDAAEKNVTKIQQVMQNGNRGGDERVRTEALIQFTNALEDDMDIPKALVLLNQLVEETPRQSRMTLQKMLKILGFDFL